MAWKSWRAECGSHSNEIRLRIEYDIMAGLVECDWIGRNRMEWKQSEGYAKRALCLCVKTANRRAHKLRVWASELQLNLHAHKHSRFWIGGYWPMSEVCSTHSLQTRVTRSSSHSRTLVSQLAWQTPLQLANFRGYLSHYSRASIICYLLAPTHSRIHGICKPPNSVLVATSSSGWPVVVHSRGRKLARAAEANFRPQKF